MLDYSFKSYPKNRKGHHLFGVEIESSSSTFPTRDYSFVPGCEFVVKSDITIDWDDWYSAGEFVSFPLPEKVLKAKVRKLYEIYSPKVNNSCGLHIHMSKSICSMRHAAEIRSGIHGLSEMELIDLAGRRLNNATEGDYCEHNTQFNLNNYSTYELRIFRGGNSYQWVNRCIDVTIALVRFRSLFAQNMWFEDFREFFKRKYGYSLSSHPV